MMMNDGVSVGICGRSRRLRSLLGERRPCRPLAIWRSWGPLTIPFPPSALNTKIDGIVISMSCVQDLGIICEYGADAAPARNGDVLQEEAVLFQYV